MAEWLEIIRVLGAFPESHPVREEIQLRLDETRKAAGLKRSMLMTKASYGSDFAVVLLWENARQPVKTREGLALAQYLQQFGSVDHAAWQVILAAPAPVAGGEEAGADKAVPGGKP
jgi:hypothetical protein